MMIDSFTVTLSLNNIKMGAATYSNNNNATTAGAINTITRYGTAFYNNLGNPYLQTFKIPNLKNADKIKILKVRHIAYNEYILDDSYYGPLLIRTNMIDNSDHILGSISLAGPTATMLNLNSIVKVDNYFRCSTPLSGSTFNFEVLSVNPTLTGGGANLIIKETYVSIYIECYGEEKS